MNIGNLLNGRSPAYHAIGPDQPLQEAVALMMHHRIGSLVVMDGERPVSIVTERDVMGAVDRYKERFSELKVRDVMAPRLVVCHRDDSMEHAMDLMMRNPIGKRIRHLPVVEGEWLVGVISIGDIVEALLTKAEFENRLLKGYIKNWPEPESAS